MIATASATVTAAAPPSARVDRSARRRIAQRLLGDDTVRSVTINNVTDVATIRYRDHRLVRRSLAAIAAQMRSNAGALGATATVDPPAVLCWADEATGKDDYVRSTRTATGWRRAMHLALAALWFTLAMIGVVVPGMPTTCFLLLTSYSLARSSDRLHRRLLDSKWFGPSLRDWRTHRGVRPGVKTKALSAMAIVVGLSIALSGLPLGALLGIAGGASIGAVCVSRLRVIEE